jgi:4-amino-4-deoxy-L-arabinose transferase-like glycosyltransferase
MRPMIRGRGTARLRQSAPILGILAVAALLRLVGLSHLPPAHYRDVAITALDALRAASGHPCLHYKFDEGLYANLMGLFFLVGGANDVMVRLLGGCAGVAACLGIFRLGRALGMERGGLFGAGLLAVSLWHVILSRSGFRAVLLPTLLVFAMAALVEALRGAGRGRFMLAGLLFGLLLHTYPSSRAAPMLLPPFLLAEIGLSKGAWRRAAPGLLIFFAAAACAAAPMLLHYLNHPADFNNPHRMVSVFSPGLGPGEASAHLMNNIVATLLMFHVRGDANWRHNISGAPMLDPLTGLLFVGGLAAALGWLFGRSRGGVERPKAAAALLLAWVAVMLLPNLLSVEGVPHGLRSAGVLPAVMLLAGVAASWLFERMLRGGAAAARAAGPGSVAVLVILAAISAWRYGVSWGGRQEVFRDHDGAYRAAARALLAAPAGAERFVVANGSGYEVHGWPAEAACYRFEMRANPPVLLGPKDAGRLALGGRTAYVALIAADPKVVDVIRTLNPGAALSEIHADGVAPGSPVYRIN